MKQPWTLPYTTKPHQTQPPTAIREVRYTDNFHSVRLELMTPSALNSNCRLYPDSIQIHYAKLVCMCASRQDEGEKVTLREWVPTGFVIPGASVSD